MADLKFTPHRAAPGVDWARDIFATNEAVRRFSEKFDRNIADANLLEDVALTAVTTTNIQHKLSRQLRGWAVARDTTPPCAFVATLDSTSGGLTAGGTVAVPFNVPTVDVGSNFDSSTGSFVAPYAGLYELAAACLISSVVDGVEMAGTFFVNAAAGLVGTRFKMGGVGTPTVTAAGLILLAEDDVVDFRIYNGGAAAETFDGPPNSFFSGHAIDWVRESTSPDESQTLSLISSIDRTVDLWVW